MAGKLGNMDDDPNNPSQRPDDDPTKRIPDPDATVPMNDTDPEAETSAVVPGQDATRPFTAPGGDIPKQIDAYRVLGELGRGGMGSVLLAVRDDDRFKKRVAIKILRRGIDTDEMLERFALERQVLGALNHPNVARLFDAGATSDGRPYIVMEYVEGRPIDLYCDENNLSLRERIELFSKVCSAVHYAHQNLIVHRDIKPSNIIVTAAGEPKLLDFGIAKLLNPELIGLDVMTRPQQRLMTYEYASPEQVQGQQITTASDVYALGVLLYELLTGHRPYHIERRIHAEAVRVICEEEPERPSTAVSKQVTVASSDGDVRTMTADEIAKRREMVVTRLKRSLSGDLDNIILKAMRKTANRRYSSAKDLADDLARHLRGEPVTARPDTWSYRSAKFVRRHRGGVAAAAVVAAALLIGIAGTAWQASVARGERDAATAAQQIAEDRYEKLRRLTRVFDGVANEITEVEGSTAARLMLSRTLLEVIEPLAREIGDDPQLRLDLAEQYRAAGKLAAGTTGDIGSGIESLERSLELLDGSVGVAGVKDARLATLVELAKANRDAGELDEASKAASDAISLGESLSPTTADSGRLTAEARRVAGFIERKRGDAETAASEFNAAERILTPLARAEMPPARLTVQLAGVHEDRGGLLSDERAHQEAVEQYRQAARLLRTVIEADPEHAVAKRRLLLTLERIGIAQLAAGNADAAEQTFRDANAIALQRVEDDPLSVEARQDAARYFEHLAGLATARNDTAGAVDAATAFFERTAELAAEDPRDIRKLRAKAVAQEKLGDAHKLASDHDASEAMYAEAVRTYQRVVQLEPSHAEHRADLVRAAYRLGVARFRLRDAEGAGVGFDIAIAAAEQLEQQRGVPVNVAEFYGDALRLRARVALMADDGRLAWSLYERAQSVVPDGSAATARREAQALAIAGEREQAITHLNAALARLTPVQGEDPPRGLDSLIELRDELQRSGEDSDPGP